MTVVDLRARVSALRAHVANSEVSTWPTCLHCMELSRARHPKMGAIWIPVDEYRVEPDFYINVPLVTGRHAVAGVEGAERLVTLPLTPHDTATVARNFHPARERNSKGWFSVIARCHGAEAEAQVDVPDWWGDAHVRAAIQGLMFFGADLKPGHGEVTRIR